MADLTELVDIDPERVDLVKNPANGFPILVMKAVAAQDEPDETPDTSGTETVKDTEVPEEKTEKTSPAPDAPEVEPVVEKSAAELAEEAVAKAVEPLQEVIKGLKDEMAALKSTPIPGGPAITVPGSQRTENERAQHLADAARHERLAKSVNDRELIRYHEEKAAEAREAAKA